MSAVAPSSNAIKGTSRPRGNKAIRALVVDENTAARTAVKGLLQSLGIDQVQQAGDPVRAIRMMEAEPFTLVLCEAQFRAQMDGSQVLEYVRTHRLLAPSSAFLVMSAEAQRSTVATVREWHPDGFVLKPLTAAALGPRIDQAMRRRRVYAPLFDAEERRDSHGLLEHARRLAEKTGGGSAELMRWEVQALLELGRFGAARKLAERAQGMRQEQSWVGVALAHCDRAAGNPDAGLQRLRETIQQHPAAGDAHDLLIEMLQEQDEVEQAIAAAREALEQMPTVRRLRVLGELAYATGDTALAEEMLGEAVRRTANSLTRCGVDTAMLAQVAIAGGDADKALKALAPAESDTDSATRAMVAAVQAQAHVARGDTGAAETAARSASSLAAAADTPEPVLCVIAQAAVAAGLGDVATQLAERAVRARRFARAPGTLARKALGEAGLDAASYVRTEPVVDAPDDRDADEAGDAAEQAIGCATQGRFDEALAHVGRARAADPADPAALLAAVHVHLLRMRAQGFDGDAAQQVRRCLIELDRQIPGDQRVFDGLPTEGG